jgi:polar amino acid transport system substrate-binding protein
MMKVKRSLVSLLVMGLFGITIFATSACDDVSDKKENIIEVLGIEFEPNFFLENQEIVGIDVDIASEAIQNAGFEMDVLMVDTWQEAYNACLAGPNKALLTTAYTPERKDLFKWAGPTSQGMYGIFQKGNAVIPPTIEACQQLSGIAVVGDWMETTTLEDLGFTNLVYYDSYGEALDAFMNGEIPFIASDFYHLTSTLPSGYYLENVHAVLRYRTVYYYIAFSKDLSDDFVSKVQSTIETMIQDQTTTSIVRNYIPLMPSDYISGTIQLFTEIAPPNSYFTGSGTELIVEGAAVDILNEIQTRTAYVNKINVTLWNDAYAIAQYLPNSAVFATARTPERENIFQWVGPITSNRIFFYSLADSGFIIETLEQAKALQSIATPNGWITHDFLVENNFNNIDVTSITTIDVFNQLMAGEVDAILLPDADVKWLADKNGIDMSQLTQHLEALDLDGYIAFSRSTPASTVQLWQTHLDDMREDGTFETIWNKWFDGIPMP